MNYLRLIHSYGSWRFSCRQFIRLDHIMVLCRITRMNHWIYDVVNFYIIRSTFQYKLYLTVKAIFLYVVGYGSLGILNWIKVLNVSSQLFLYIQGWAHAAKVTMGRRDGPTQDSIRDSQFPNKGRWNNLRLGHCTWSGPIPEKALCEKQRNRTRGPLFPT